MPEKIEISDADLTFKYSRSSGPGGQNVNKLSTKVTLFFDLTKSDLFSDVQKSRIRKNLAGRIDKNGFIKIVSQKHRTQNANRKTSLEKLKELLSHSLKEATPRRKTQVPHWARQKRIERKRRRSIIKEIRAAKNFEA